MSKRKRNELPPPPPALPYLPKEIWREITLMAADTVANAGNVRLVRKRFAKSITLRRHQLRLAFNEFLNGRETRRVALGQADRAAGVSEHVCEQRELVRKVEYVGDSRLAVFTSLLVARVDPEWKLAIRRHALDALRQTGEWFKDLDVR